MKHSVNFWYVNLEFVFSLLEFVLLQNEPFIYIDGVANFHYCHVALLIDVQSRHDELLIRQEAPPGKVLREVAPRVVYTLFERSHPLVTVIKDLQ